MNPHLTAREEKELVQRCQRDPSAIRDLYRYYHPRIYAYVAHRVGRVTDAEDITSEIFIRVVQAIPRFEYRGEGSLSAWIFHIARNEVRRLYRQQQRLPWMDTPLDDLPIISNVASPDQQVIAQQEFERLRRYIDRLSDRRQEIIRLRFYGGLRNQEIAEVLSLDERTVASHLCRALEDLRRMTQQDHILEERHER